MKKRLFRVIVLLIQRSLTYVSYFIFKFFGKSEKRKAWVVGVEEVAGMAHQIASVVPNSISVILYPHRFYNHKYTFNNGIGASKFKTLLIGPWLLGKLLHQSQGFIYVGGSGLLFSHYDNRYWEFNFIKRKNRNLVTYFTGADIRSISLMKEEFAISGEENFSNYVGWIDPWFDSQEHDAFVKQVAQVADQFSDLIFNSEYDQKSYLESTTEPFLYFHSMVDLHFLQHKFSPINLKTIKIAHAPSSPLVKGTQVIRTIIRMLKNEGYNFEYIEIINEENSVLISKIKECHVVINELYGFMPGVLAIEAMANSCVVLTRADRTYEKRLAPESNEAWIVTPSYKLYDNLKDILENPKDLEKRARAGFDWVSKSASSEINGPILIEKLNRIGMLQL